MDLMIKHKSINDQSVMIYDHWISEYVNKGRAGDYLILQYPDIVQVIYIEPSGHRQNYKITDRVFAQKIVNESPETFEFVDIDVRQQIALDIELSNKISDKNQPSSKSLSFLNNSGKIQYLTKIKVIIGAIKSSISKLSPVWKIILAIIIAGIGTLLGHILIEWYKSFYSNL
jgi:hypothetical protein